MKYFIYMVLFLIVAFGCSDNDVNNPLEDDRQPFVIHPLEYSRNHYVLDLVYLDPQLNIFKKYFASEPSVYNNYYTVKKIELWKTTAGLYNPSERRSIIDGYERRIIPLVEGTDYLFNKYVGMISLLNTLSNTEYLAVAYKIEGETTSDIDDIQDGRFSNESNNQLVLTVIARPNSFTILQLKNIYSIRNKNISSNNFSFDISFMKEKNKPSNYFQNVRLLKAFGFDSDSDGNFDFKEGKTIISQTGEIIFPSIEPFGDDLPGIFFSKQRDTLVSPYQIKCIYNDSDYYAASDSNASKYYCYGKYYVK